MIATLEVHRYHQRSDEVSAIQVSHDNLEAVARWVNGTLHRHTREHDDWIEIPEGGFAGGFSKAFVGSWILRYPDGMCIVVPDDQFRAPAIRRIWHAA